MMTKKDYEKKGIATDGGIRVISVKNAFEYSKKIIAKILRHAKKVSGHGY